MPSIRVNGASLYYEESGAGAETIVFSHGLLWDHRMFAPQIAALRDRYRCIAYDHRGQGKSEVTADGYDMDTLSEDAAALIRELNAAPCHFVGLSMGGFVGMRLAARQPDLLKSLILIETTADPEPENNVPRYKTMNLIARWLSLKLVTRPVMKIMFGEKFLTDPTRESERQEMIRRLHGNHRLGITRATAGVYNRQPIYDEIHTITHPSLILVGDQDKATVPAKSERIHARIAGSEMHIIPGAGHTSSLEEPAAVTEAIERFLAKQ